MYTIFSNHQGSSLIIGRSVVVLDGVETALPSKIFDRAIISSDTLLRIEDGVDMT